MKEERINEYEVRRERRFCQLVIRRERVVVYIGEWVVWRGDYSLCILLGINRTSVPVEGEGFLGG